MMMEKKEQTTTRLMKTEPDNPVSVAFMFDKIKEKIIDNFYDVIRF